MNAWITRSGIGKVRSLRGRFHSWYHYSLTLQDYWAMGKMRPARVNCLRDRVDLSKPSISYHNGTLINTTSFDSGLVRAVQNGVTTWQILYCRRPRAGWILGGHLHGVHSIFAFPPSFVTRKTCWSYHLAGKCPLLLLLLLAGEKKKFRKRVMKTRRSIVHNP